MYSPIIIFVYNRKDKLEKLIKSLIKNHESKYSELYIFSDSYKSENDRIKVNEVREYIDKLRSINAFKNVVINKSETNKGLSKSIIEGVSEVLNKYDKAIIIEDDNIVSPDFIDYMNRGLEFYRFDSRIWAISGYSRNITFPYDYNHDIYLMQRISSYSWATWKDRWDLTKWDIEDIYPSYLFDYKKRKIFSKCGEDRPLMLDALICKKVNSWAIRFEYSMVENNAFSVLPCVSRVKCNGNDGSGTHSKKENHIFDTILSDGKNMVQFETIEQDERIREEFIKPYKSKFLRRLFKNSDYILYYYFKMFKKIFANY